jgi:FdhD protein
VSPTPNRCSSGTPAVPRKREGDIVSEIRTDGTRRPISRHWVPETPVALEFNGLSYAVMMATPADLEDFARGFALTEGLARSPADVTDIAVAETDLGWIVRARLAGLGVEKLTERVRARVAESSCGLCGIENLEAVARPLPKVPAHAALDEAAIFTALSALRDHQPLTKRTGAAHAAAFCDEAGNFLHAREDVGRHNAMDKLIGALAAAGENPAAGFILSTARCSYEIVEKAVRAGTTRLATVSLPTSMAVERAREAGLSLWCLARDDSVLMVNAGAAGS